MNHIVGFRAKGNGAEYVGSEDLVKARVVVLNSGHRGLPREAWV